MTECNTTADNHKIFMVGHSSKDGKLSGSYPVTAHEHATADLVWMSEKCWFMPGTVVTITDYLGNSKTFVKE